MITLALYIVSAVVIFIAAMLALFLFMAILTGIAQWFKGMFLGIGKAVEAVDKFINPQPRQGVNVLEVLAVTACAIVFMIGVFIGVAL